MPHFPIVPVIKCFIQGRKDNFCRELFQFDDFLLLLELEVVIKMYSNTANMLKQTTNLINALIKLKQNLTFVKSHVNSDKTLAIYFLSNAYSDFNLFKTIYLSVTPGDQKIDEFLQEHEKFFLEVNKYLELFNDDNVMEDKLHKEVMFSINETERYLLNLLDMYR